MEINDVPEFLRRLNSDPPSLPAEPMIKVACVDDVSMLRRQLFDKGFLELRSGQSNFTHFARSSTILDPTRAGATNPKGAISICSLGNYGRFGNQLFQYMFVRLYALRNGLELKTPPWQGEQYFEIDDTRSAQGEFPELPFEGFDTNHLILWGDDAPLHDVNFSGNFQELPACFAAHRQFLRSLFSPRQEVRATPDFARKKLTDDGHTLVAVHLRRGDYESKDHYAEPQFRVVPTSWYLDLLRDLWPKLKNPVLCVASDGGDAVRDQFSEFNLLPKDYFSSPRLPDFLSDFYALSQADVLAICNSSFSRMAALLGPIGQQCFLPDFERARFMPYDPWEKELFWDHFSPTPSPRPHVSIALDTAMRDVVAARLALGKALHNRTEEISAVPAHSVPCKLCGADAHLACVVDFNRWGASEEPVKLPLKGWPVYYRRCEACDFVFTDYFDKWDVHKFQRLIYNEEFMTLAPDLIGERPARHAQTIATLFPHCEKLGVLNYGAANLALHEALKSKGFVDIARYDFFDAQYGHWPERSFDIVTCFDVLERVPDPGSSLDEICGHAGKDGVVIIGLEVTPDTSTSQEMEGWPFGPRSGHAGLFTERSLAKALEARGFKLAELAKGLYLSFVRLPDFANHLKFAIIGS